MSHYLLLILTFTYGGRKSALIMHINNKGESCFILNVIRVYLVMIIL